MKGNKTKDLRDKRAHIQIAKNKATTITAIIIM